MAVVPEGLPQLNAELDRLAAKYDVTATAIATAWITRNPADMQMVQGTTTPQRIRQAAQSSDIPLARPGWYVLIRAAGHNALVKQERCHTNESCR